MISLFVPTLLAISLNSPAAIQDYIIFRSMEYGYPVSKALEIARCESNFIPTAKNPGSSAGGIFQFINSTWKNVMIDMNLPLDTNKFDPYFNIEAGIYLLSKDGDHHWNESKFCWNPRYLKTIGPD